MNVFFNSVLWNLYLDMFNQIFIHIDNFIIICVSCLTTEFFLTKTPQAHLAGAVKDTDCISVKR